MYTLNETYNRPPYILAAGSGNLNWWSKVVSCIRKETPCPNSSSYFISVRRLFLTQAQSEQRYARFKKSHNLLHNK